MCSLSYTKDGIQVNTMGNYQMYDEKYYTLEHINKGQIKDLTIEICNKTRASKVKDKNNIKDFYFPIITEKETYEIFWRHCSGYKPNYIADLLTNRRLEEYKKVTGRYAEKKIKFPISRVNQIIRIINKRFF